MMLCQAFHSAEEATPEFTVAFHKAPAPDGDGEIYWLEYLEGDQQALAGMREKLSEFVAESGGFTYREAMRSVGPRLRRAAKEELEGLVASGKLREEKYTWNKRTCVRYLAVETT